MNVKTGDADAAQGVAMLEEERVKQGHLFICFTAGLVDVNGGQASHDVRNESGCQRDATLDPRAADRAIHISVETRVPLESEGELESLITVTQRNVVGEGVVESPLHVVVVALVADGEREVRLARQEAVDDGLAKARDCAHHHSRLEWQQKQDSLQDRQRQISQRGTMFSAHDVSIWLQEKREERETRREEKKRNERLRQRRQQ